MRVGSLLLAATGACSSGGLSGARYTCKDGGCYPQANGTYATQQECFIVCGYLWPKPKEVTVQEHIGAPVAPCWNVKGDAMSRKMAETFCEAEKVKKKEKHPLPELELHVQVSGHNPDSERYSLQIAHHIATINADSHRGVRYAMETLRQLTARTDRGNYLPSSAVVSDEPAYPYRGILVDTSRHFLPIHILQRIIRGMAMAKLNTLHLHLTDTASFPLEVPSNPRMTDTGAYSHEQVYTVDDIKELVAYAELYAVRLLPELDVPAHVNAGWDDHLVVCAQPPWADRALEPPSGQLNVANDEIYDRLKDIYQYLHKAFPGGELHMGGDEVIIGDEDGAWAKCWNSSLAQPILDMLEEKGLDRGDRDTFYGLWANFTVKALGLARGAGFKKFIQWGGGHPPSAVTYSLVLRENIGTILPPADVDIMVWDELEGSVAGDLIKAGYDIILANSDYVYLDCGASGWVRPGGYWCQPYNEWYKMYGYLQDVRKFLKPEEMKHVRGGEVLNWGESSDEHNAETRIWPRAAALAEALWSDPLTGWYQADPRMNWFSGFLSRNGIPSTPLQPEWCNLVGPYRCTLEPSRRSLLTSEFRP